MCKTRISVAIIIFSLFCLLNVSTGIAKDVDALVDNAVDKIRETIDVINSLDSEAFKNKKDRNKLTKNLDKAIKDLEKGKYEKALKILEKDVLGKADGCALNGRPDKKDQITDCDAQDEVYFPLLVAIALVEEIIDEDWDDDNGNDNDYNGNDNDDNGSDDNDNDDNDNDDNDGDGFTEGQGDCDDTSPAVNPDAKEICDSIDNNCNGQIDEGVQTTYYEDADSDGYGNPDVTTDACQQPSGYIINNTDCDDNDANEHPDQTWYRDEDNDGYSDGTTNATSCTRPGGYKSETELTATSGDCDDNDAAINPDAQEIPADGIDQNCNGRDLVAEINITSPTDGSTINSSNTIVKGEFSTNSQEVGIIVNTVFAEIVGSEFVANAVQLGIGENTLTVVLTDEDGNTATDTITVYTNVYQDQVNLSANITSGVSPLDVKFSIDTSISNQIITYEMDFDGDGVIDQTITDLDNVTYTYNQERIYYPIITVTDDQNNQYMDTIGIIVINKEEITALLRVKWNEMSTALMAGNINTALNYFVAVNRERYNNTFTELGTNKINSIFSNISSIELQNIDEKVANCAALREELGGTYGYPVTFVKDENGLWKIMGF